MTLLKDTLHITSLIVQTNPTRCKNIAPNVQGQVTASVFPCDIEGKLIVLLETDNENQILETINQIQNIEGVISVTMVYHHIDEQ